MNSPQQGDCHINKSINLGFCCSWCSPLGLVSGAGGPAWINKILDLYFQKGNLFEIDQIWALQKKILPKSIESGPSKFWFNASINSTTKFMESFIQSDLALWQAKAWFQQRNKFQTGWSQAGAPNPKALESGASTNKSFLISGPPSLPSSLLLKGN